MNARPRKMLLSIGLPAVVIMLLTVQIVHAEVYKYKLVATVQQAPDGNPCGIGPGSHITGTITFDTEQVALVPCGNNLCFRGGDMMLILSPLDGCQTQVTSMAAVRDSWIRPSASGDALYLSLYFASAGSPESSMWQGWYDILYPTMNIVYDGMMQFHVQLAYINGSNDLGSLVLPDVLANLYLDPGVSGNWMSLLHPTWVPPPPAMVISAELTEFELITPPILIMNLINTTAEINAQSGILNSLDAKLDSAVKALDDANESNDASAVYRLQAFINAVEAQRGNQISEVEADSLVATAQEIIDMLSMQ